MGSIFDGIQRPLSDIHQLTQSIYIPKGINTPSLRRDAEWDLKLGVKVGSLLSGGDVYGEVEENNLIKHKLMLAGRGGVVKWVASDGRYTLEVRIQLTILKLRFTKCCDICRMS